MYVTIPTDFATQTDVAQLASAHDTSPRTRLKSGAYLYFEDDAVDWLYQVTSGVVRLTRLLEDGRRQVIAFGYPGDIVGFPASGLHHTDCQALVETELQPYHIAHLESCASDPVLHRALLQAALTEISAMQDHFMMLGRKSAVERVASFLCVLADRVGRSGNACPEVELPMSRADIADFLGLTTETVSRTFTQLRKREIIAIENIHTVKVLAPSALLDLSLGGYD